MLLQFAVAVFATATVRVLGDGVVARGAIARRQILTKWRLPSTMKSVSEREK